MFAGIMSLKTSSNNTKKNKKSRRESCFEYLHSVLLIQWLNLTETLQLRLHGKQCNQHLFPSRLLLSPPFSLPEQALPGDMTVSHITSLRCLLTLRLFAHHIHNRPCNPTQQAAARAASTTHTWITQTGSCGELQFECVGHYVCVCVCVCARVS